MLTQEQIKSLKHGDPVIIHGTFNGTYYDGDIKISHKITGHEKVKDAITFAHPSSVSLPSEHGTFLSRRSSEGAETEVPTPKHDPCRLFKKGDKVKLTKWNGRICEKFFREGIYCGENLTVERDEDCFLNVTVSLTQGLKIAVPSPFLQLVTPVEELEPYYVKESTGTITLSSKLDPIYHTCWHYSTVKAGIEALDAAEAECKRLNDEYRKEQK
jgi:hypothetical protein